MKYEEISILVQGAIDKENTRKVLRCLRELFSMSEIILSTWYGSDVCNLDYDKLILSEDPGFEIVDEKVGTYNNINRQILSTKVGLEVVSRKYTLKTRTDIMFNDTNFLKYFDKYDYIQSKYFKKRLLICNYYTRNPRVFDTCFHPSDWILFGLSEDVKKYYDIKLQSKEEFLWFKNRKKESKFFINYLSRFTPEQYIFLSFLRKNKKIDIDCYYDTNIKLVELTEKTFADCFVVLDYKKNINILFSKYNPNRYKEKYSLINHWKWKALYDKYCKKKSTLRWYLYICYGILFRTLSFFRGVSIKILDFFSLKEKVKKILSHI